MKGPHLPSCGLSPLYRSRKSFKASRLSRCGTGVPLFHRGKDFRVPKYWDTEFGPFLFAQPDAWQDATVAEILPTRYRRGNDLGVPKVGDRTRGLPKRLFVQCVRVPDLWDTELTLAETLVFTRVSVSQHFGTRNLGQVPRLFLRITRVPRLWLTTLDHDYQDNDPAFI